MSITYNLLKYLTLSPKPKIISNPVGAILLTNVVPESCQRTEGIFAWLEMKAKKEKKQFEKEERKREKEEYFKKMA